MVASLTNAGRLARMNSLTTYWLCRAPGSATEGPFTLGQLRAMYGSGSITSEAKVCMNGQKNWKSLDQTLPKQASSEGFKMWRVMIWLLVTVLIGLGSFEYGKEYLRSELKDKLAAAFKPKPEPVQKPEKPIAEVISSALQNLENSTWAPKIREMLKGGVLVEYDKFKKSTTYRLKSNYSLSSDVMLEGYVVSHDDESSPSIFFIFRRTDENWKWLNYHVTTMKLDDKTWTDSNRIYSDTLGAGMVTEAKTVMFTLEQALALDSAKEVAVQIGNTELDLSSDGRLAILAPLMQWLLETNQKLKAK